ncbi:RinA family protein [Clostridium felsineum]|uniref:RinA family protein n=1 Tax=Clostridium felsineum TaxID=36839 RepID=UPI00214DC6C1|nr:RinA family protein [Clostridium felsineum]MCR3760301.1 RinA family protein [Clostridium felsineum]
MIDKDLYKKTDGVLFNYQVIKMEIKNLELEIEEISATYNGVGAISYEEKSGHTNKFNSVVENEVINKEKIINKLNREMNSKKRLIAKVDNAMEILNENERKIVEYRCVKGYSWSRIGALLNMDGDYCGRIKREVMNKISPLIWIRESMCKKVGESK